MSMITTLSENNSTAGGVSDSMLPHVLLVVDQFARTLGGGERIVLKLASLLPKYGYRVSILTFSAHPESAALRSPPCPIYLLSLQRTYDFHALKAAFELKQFLREQRIQIVQTFFESSDLWAGFVTKTMSDAKLIWSRRDMGILRGRKHRIAYRRMSGVPDRVFAVSEQVRRHCIDVDGIEPSRVQTIYNGLDLADWTSASKPAKLPGEFLVTTVGNIRRVKGHDVLIKAAGLVVKQFPGVVFSIAGEVLNPIILRSFMVSSAISISRSMFVSPETSPTFANICSPQTSSCFLRAAKDSPMPLSRRWPLRFPLLQRMLEEMQRLLNRA